MSNKETPFITTFKEKEFSKYDWQSLSDTSSSPSGNLGDLCDKLSSYIDDYTKCQSYKPHSNLHQLLTNLFNAHLSWTDPDNINIYLLLNYASNKLLNKNESKNELEHKLSKECQLLILDILSLHWAKIKAFEKLSTKNQSTEYKAKYDKFHQKYANLARCLHPLIDEVLLKTKLNAECCHSLKLFQLKLPKTKDIDPISMLVRRRKTKIHFVQNKFNLLIEESEGYSKLITELAEHLQGTQYRQSVYSYQNHNYDLGLADYENDGDGDQEDDDIKMTNGYGHNHNHNHNHNGHIKVENKDEDDDDDDDVDMAMDDDENNTESKNDGNDGNNGNNDGNNNLQHKPLENKIFNLIGQFKLDPNRVIDLILHALEYDVNNGILLRILNDNFNPENIVTILGFKFKFFKRADNLNKSVTSNQQTPNKLFILTVHLIHYNIIKLSDILPHLSYSLNSTYSKSKSNTKSSPTKQNNMNNKTLMDQHIEDRKTFERNEKQRARLINFVNLNDTTEDKILRNKKESQLFDKRKSYHISQEKSQIFQLLLYMIKLGDWKNTNEFLSILYDAHCESKHFINNALMDLLQNIISPLYNKYCKIWMMLASSSFLKNIEKEHKKFDPLDKNLILQPNDTDLLKLPEIIAPIIAAINVYLHRRPILYGKICRILDVIMKKTFNRHNTNDSDDKIFDIIEETMYHLLASYSLVENNTGLSKDLWNLLSHFNFSYRFKFYGYWKDVMYDKYPELWCQREDAKKDTKYLLRRYHVDESSQKKLGRMFARYINCQPVLVFELVLKQLQAYSGNVSTVVDGFRYLTNLDRDVLIWQILCECEKSTKKIRIDTYYEEWFRALCDITGQFFKNFYDSDILPVLQYVVNKLISGYADHLLIFKTIITKLTQIEAFGEVITYEQLNCVAGSELLKQVSLQLDNKYQNYTSSRRSKIIKKISKTLINNKMIIPIFVLLSNVFNSFSYNYNPNEINSFMHFNIMPTQIDITNDMFVQLFLFMKHHIYAKYKEQLKAEYPTLRQLFIEHKVRTSYCFMLLRLYRKEKEINNNNGDIIFNIKEIEDIFNKLKIWKAISPTCFSIFWSLEISDIFIPKSEYETVIRREEEKAKQHGKDLKIYPPQHQLRDEEYINFRKKKREKKSCEDISKDLKHDKEEQQRNVEKTIENVFKSHKYNKDEWFIIQSSGSSRDICKIFLFECILPRINTSDIDAKYCAKFIELLVKSSVKNFFLMDFAKVFLENINQILSSSTHSESRRLGRFLQDFMLILEKYRANKDKVFDQFTNLEACKITLNNNTIKVMNHEDFCTEFRSMHRSLTIFLVYLMKSDNLLWQKNSILVLNELQLVFPKVLSHAKHLKSKVGIIKANTVKGTSMAILCERVIAILEKGVSSGSYIDEQKFGGRNLGPNQSSHSTNSSSSSHTTSNGSTNNNNNNNTPSVKSQQSKPKVTPTSSTNDQNKINELRRKALESQSRKKDSKKRRFSEIEPTDDNNTPNSSAHSSPKQPQAKRSRIDDKSPNNSNNAPPNTNSSTNKPALAQTVSAQSNESKDRERDSNRSDRDRPRKSGNTMKLRRSSSHGSHASDSGNNKDKTDNNKDHRMSSRSNGDRHESRHSTGSHSRRDSRRSSKEKERDGRDSRDGRSSRNRSRDRDTGRSRDDRNGGRSNGSHSHHSHGSSRNGTDKINGSHSKDTERKMSRDRSSRDRDRDGHKDGHRRSGGDDARSRRNGGDESGRDRDRDGKRDKDHKKNNDDGHKGGRGGGGDSDNKHKNDKIKNDDKGYDRDRDRGDKKDRDRGDRDKRRGRHGRHGR